MADVFCVSASSCFIPQIPDGASFKVITKKVHAPLSPQTSLKGECKDYTQVRLIIHITQLSY